MKQFDFLISFHIMCYVFVKYYGQLITYEKRTKLTKLKYDMFMILSCKIYSFSLCDKS